MSQAVALNQKKQGRFAKKVKNVKEKVSKGVITVQENINKRKAKPVLGLIYIGHIPHGFYEDELKAYFKQFGVVTNVRVCRSKKTGRSKGYGFVQFHNAEVAQIAAETMDNYLMFNRRLICKYIPPEKQHKNMFSKIQWSITNYPKKLTRIKHIKKRNENPTEKQLVTTTKKVINNFKKKIDKLAALGIKHTFVPNDVPDEMKHLLPENNSDNADAHDTEIEDVKEVKINERACPRIVKTTNDFKVSRIARGGKTLKSIVKKKDKLKKNVLPISFMENERLKRLAAAEILNDAIVSTVNKFKNLRSSRTKVLLK